MIETAFADADHLVIITAPAKLSAIYESMRLGAADLPPDRVTLIDSGTVTMRLGYQVWLGAEAAKETGDLDHVLQVIKRVREYSTFGVMIGSLDNLRRSGRINFAAAGLGTLLQIKPLITIDKGEITVVSRVRTAKRARQELVNMLREQAPLDRLALLHTNSLEEVEWMREQIADIAPAEIDIINATPTLGTHVGAQSLGFVALNENWRH